jgi:hypothetical protein
LLVEEDTSQDEVPTSEACHCDNES